MKFAFNAVLRLRWLQSLSFFGSGIRGGDFSAKESGFVGGSVFVLARLELGSTLTFTSFARLGSSASVSEGIQVRQSASIRGSAITGATLSARYSGSLWPLFIKRKDSYEIAATGIARKDFSTFGGIF
jgi:hypothetical protein